MLTNGLMIATATFAMVMTAMGEPQHKTNIEIRTQTMRSVPVIVLVNEEKVNFSDQGPMMSGARVYVPMRGVFEKMNANLEWMPGEQKVVAMKGDKKIELWIGKSSAMVDGATVALDAPARLVNGRTLVPLRFISESLGADVNWIEEERKVVIKTDG